MKKIAVGTLKGGTGKTTVAFHLAGEIARNSRVLLVDMDPQCNLSNNTGIDIASQDIYSCRDIFETKGIRPEDLVIESPIADLPNLDIIPSHILLTATELLIGSRAARERILEYFLEDNEKFFSKYDYILMDTNPSMGIINQNAFFAADSIILVTDVDENSRVGLQMFIYLWEEIRRSVRKKDNVRALIVNKFDVRTRISHELIEYIKSDDELSKILLSHTIKNKVAYQYAALEKMPVCLYRNGQEAAEEIACIAQELKERGVL